MLDVKLVWSKTKEYTSQVVMMECSLWHYLWLIRRGFSRKLPLHHKVREVLNQDKETKNLLVSIEQYFLFRKPPAPFLRMALPPTLHQLLLEKSTALRYNYNAAALAVSENFCGRVPMHRKDRTALLAGNWCIWYKLQQLETTHITIVDQEFRHGAVKDGPTTRKVSTK
ncbi:hypothetical protein Q3G72_011544 [Acer saccharum]|nr:hypothetical protein Q3G72_011544 [Acer saccharum]